MKLNDKQTIAKELYLYSPLNQKEIAVRVGITEVTMSKWVKKFGWEMLKTSQTLTKDNLIRVTYQQIGEIQKAISEENRVITPSESDQILKLSKVIENLDKKVSISLIIQVFIEFERWMDAVKSEHCQLLNELHNDFINNRIQQ